MIIVRNMNIVPYEFPSMPGGFLCGIMGLKKLKEKFKDK